MTAKQHKLKHKQLHKALDELVADWLSRTTKMPSESTILDLMWWSHNQTVKPDEQFKHWSD